MSLSSTESRDRSARSGNRRARIGMLLPRLAIAIALLAIVGLSAINLLLMLPVMKHRLERGISEAVGSTVRIGRVTWSPWGGVRARNIRIAGTEQAAAIADAPFFESDTAWVKVRISPLFSGVLDIAEIGVDAPRIACVRGADGRFLLPFEGSMSINGAGATGAVFGANANVFADADATLDAAGEAPQGKADASGAADTDRPADKASDGESAAQARNSSGSGGRVAPAATARSLEVRLQDLVIREGTVTLLGIGDGEGIAELRDFEMRLNLGDSSPGGFHAASAHLFNKLNVTDIGGAVTATAGGFEFRDLTATWRDGKITGAATVGLTKPGLPFEVKLEAGGLTLGAFANLTGAVGLDAEITARLQLQGFAKAPDTIRGALVFDGLRVPMGAARATVALDDPGEEWTETLDFEIARVIFRLSQGGVVFDDVNFNADEVVLRAVGSASAAGELNVAVRAYVPETALSVMRSFMRGWPRDRVLRFNALGDTDFVYRDMLMRGKITEFEFDVWNDGRFRAFAALSDEIRALREAANQAGLAPASAATATDGSSTDPIPLPETFEPGPGETAASAESSDNG